MSQVGFRRALLTGGCQCGAVRYAIYSLPEEASVCHCRMCQKAVGGPFAAYATVRNVDLEWTRGRPAAFASSTAAERDFCPNCGTPLTFRYLATDRTGVAIGSLDRPECAMPSIQYGIESRIGWLDVIASLPGRVTLTDDAPDYVRALLNFQHPDHDAPADWQPPRPPAA